MRSEVIRAEIDKIRALASSANWKPSAWMPLWEIAYQLAVLNERIDEINKAEEPST